ncbi:MAG: hypothetical protein RLY31_2061 [Bacteroidota bacterium]|jgi:putative MATE family efflux protein
MTVILQALREAISSENKSFTTGSLNRAIVLLSIPMVLEMIMEGVFVLVDAYWVSRLSVEAVATVGLTETVMTMVYALAAGLSTATAALVARRTGEGNREGVALAAVQAMFLTAMVSVLLGIPGFLLVEEILYWMGGTDSLVAACSGYTAIMFATNGIILFLFVFNAVFRGAGQPIYAMWVLLFANSVNLVLDPVLIFGWGPVPAMGVEGAALATVIGRGSGVLLQVYLLLKGTGLLLERRHLVLVRRTVIRLMQVSAGGTGQYIISSASWVFLVRIVAEFGSEAVAGYTIAIRVIIFTFMPVWGLGNAASTLVGQNLGAGQPARAAASAWRTAHLTMGFLAFVSLVLAFSAPFVLPLFSEIPSVVGTGVQTLRIFSVSYTVYAYGLILSQSFNGAGDTRTPTLVNFICFWLLEIPLGYWLAIRWEGGVPGVCWAVAISETVMSLAMIYLFRKGHWKKQVL